jgi:hypothetical protein
MTDEEVAAQSAADLDEPVLSASDYAATGVLPLKDEETVPVLVYLQVEDFDYYYRVWGADMSAQISSDLHDLARQRQQPRKTGRSQTIATRPRRVSSNAVGWEGYTRPAAVSGRRNA